MPAKRTIAAMIVAGGLQTLALSPFDIWPLAFLSFLVLLFFSKILDPGTPLTPKKAFFLGWWLGLGLFASGASWVYVSINTYGHAPPPLAAALTLFFVAGLALFHAVAFSIYASIRTKSLLRNAAIFPAIWVLNDVFRSFFLTGFPWLFVGDSQVDGPLMALLPLFGTYGVSFLICMLSTLVYAAFHLRNRMAYLTAASVCLAVVLSTALLKDVEWTKPVGKSLSVALLQINIPQELKWTSSQKPKTVALLRDISEQHSDKDVIFWPETAIPFLYDRATPLINNLANMALKADTAIVSGIPYREWNSDTRSSVMHNSITAFGEGEGLYHKQKLVPFGEYVPLQDLLRGLIQFFDLPMSDFRPGPQNQKLLKTKGYSVAPFICYEVVYPDFVAYNARNADYLLTISNDSWFGSSIGPHQHLQIARSRAIENGRFMVRATNNGVTAIIDQNGRITSQIPQFEQAVLEGQVDIYSGQTPFSKWRSWPIVILSLALLATAVVLRLRKRQ